VINALTTDADLQIAVSQKLAMAPDLRDEFVRVSSYRGMVTLHGRVDRAEDAEQALELAGEVPGVRAVISRMDVKAAA
jgi:osmotically-inducible protein OsmY